jgi:hypothetical protein
MGNLAFISDKFNIFVFKLLILDKDKIKEEFLYICRI